jgi:hypothetical protein
MTTEAVGRFEPWQPWDAFVRAITSAQYFDHLEQPGVRADLRAGGVLVAQLCQWMGNVGHNPRILMVTRKKKKFSVGNKKSTLQPLKHIEVSLDDLEIRLAAKLGDGDLTLGIRRAVVIASMRQF